MLFLKKQETDQYSLPRFLHEDSGLYFRFIKSGFFDFGFDKKVIDFLKENSEFGYGLFKDESSTQLLYKGFYVCETLLTNEFLKKQGFLLFEDNTNYAVVTFSDLFNICERFGFSIPSEIQIEAVMKQNYPDLFCWGSFIDSDESLSIEQIDAYMNNSPDKDTLNKFGVSGLSHCTWTSTPYHYEELVPDAQSGFVIKSGGAEFWPWQSEDWFFSLPAFYFSSKENPAEKFCGRVIINEDNAIMI